MAQSGVNYFLSEYASNFSYRDSWKIFFDFKNSSINPISKSGAHTLYSGVTGRYSSSTVSNTYDYVDLKSDTYIKISPLTGLWSQDFSLLFLAEKTQTGSCLLFNCFESGLYNGQNVFKGYKLGYTDTNKLFFQYYNNEGLKTYSLQQPLNNKHSVFCVKDGDDLILGSYDFVAESFNSQSFSVDSNYFLEPSSGYYIGNWTGNTRFEKRYNFPNPSVILDEFIYFSSALYEQDIELINSGWVADYMGLVTGSGIITTTGVTGYSTGLVQIFSGVTGYSITGTGLLTNEYGVYYTGYLSGALIGVIYGSGVTELTGAIQTVDLFIGEPNIVINTGFLRSFYNSGFVFLRNIDKDDTVNFYAETGLITDLNYNNFAIYDSIEDIFKVFQTEPLISWLNGISQYSGKLITTGSIYNPIYILENDYFRTGNYIDSTGYYDSIDTFNYLNTIKVNYLNKNFSYTGGAALTLTGTYSGNNTLVFFNGQNLSSGQYKITGNNVIFDTPLYSGASGELSIVAITGSYLNRVFTGAFLSSGIKFNQYYSLVFLNGQQQIPNVDFIFADTPSLLMGSGIFQVGESQVISIINTNDLFFNII